MRHLFPQTVSYNRFVELMAAANLPLAVFVKTCCMGACTGISFMDSTPLRVYKNKRIYRNKVFEGIGKLYADKEDITAELTNMLFCDGIHLITQIRNNMKNCLMELKDKILLRKYSIH